ANQPKRSCQTLYTLQHPQLTQLGQIGQPTVQQTLLFGSISVHAVGNFSTLESAFNLRETKFRKSCFFETEINDPRPQICLSTMCWCLATSNRRGRAKSVACTRYGTISLRGGSTRILQASGTPREECSAANGSQQSSYDHTETRRRVS